LQQPAKTQSVVHYYCRENAAFARLDSILCCSAF